MHLSQLTALYFTLACISPYVEPHSSIHSQYLMCVLQYEPLSTSNAQMQFCQLSRHRHSAFFCSNIFYNSARLGLQVSECGSAGYSCNLWRAQRRWEIFTQATVICLQQICALSNALWLETLAFIIHVAVSVPEVSVKIFQLQDKVVILN